MRHELMKAFGVFALLASLAAGCGDGSDGEDGRDGRDGLPGDPPPIDTILEPEEDLPGMNLEILSIAGGTGFNGNFEPGDTIAITFTIETDEGDRIPLDEIDRSEALVSGPTVNYNRVLPNDATSASYTDLHTRATLNPDGSYTYRFPAPLPAVYPPPLNDSPSFDIDDGELQGLPLQAGTYTVGIRAYKTYSIGTEIVRDAGSATRDFLVGTATALQPRAVVGLENCNACHVRLKAHGEGRPADLNVTYCLLCHTSGAEDRNKPSVEGGTPGITIDFKVMIHKIHNAARLPSVLGVTTKTDGTRDYTATPKPYKMVGFNDTVIDFSHVVFPVWPNLNIGMPRDFGYSSLTSAQKAIEDQILRGATDCNKCHGDPDGAGPLAAPPDGGLAYAQPSFKACNSCHDDYIWDRPYTSNQTSMPASRSDATCVQCHPASGADPLAVETAHIHPVVNPNVNPGLNFIVTAVTDAAGGKVDPGDKVLVTFELEDDSGTPVPPSSLSAINLYVTGPLENRNRVHGTSVPPAWSQLQNGPSYTFNPPMAIVHELIVSSGADPETIKVSKTPIWNITGAATSIRVVTNTAGVATELDADAPALRNYLDVNDVTGFAKDNLVAIDDGAAGEEYAEIAFVETGRLWLKTPLQFAHSAGAPVEKVLFTSLTSAQFSVNGATGEITEVGGDRFGPAGQEILVSYTTDFIMPSVYQPTVNDTDDLGETWGDWVGKEIVSGTYELSMWGYRTLPSYVFPPTAVETNSYRQLSPAGVKTFLVGSATQLATYRTITSNANCFACHNDIYFHGTNRRGYESCLVCHGIGGAEDWPLYSSPAGPLTPGVSIDFRQMLHRIHAGKQLEAEYVLAGRNGVPATFEEIGFPAMPSGVKDCKTCHGLPATGRPAFAEPVLRDHPTEQGAPVRNWTIVCNSCHNSDTAGGHMEVMTFMGLETCEVCHGPSAEFNVELMHKVR